MPADTDGTRRFSHRVVAVRDDMNDEEVGLNSLELGSAFEFVAYYTPPATVLFRLSLSLTDDMTFYLQYPPQVVSSLKKTTCDEKNERNRPRCFPAVKNHLGCRSFARLQFKLHGLGQLITPAGFALGDCKDTKLRRTFALAASLAAASAFSLYLPRDALTNREYNAFSDVHKQWPARTADQNAELERMMDLQKMYKGRGGALFSKEDQTRLLSLEFWAAGTGVDAGPPPSYSKHPSAKPPEYDVGEPSSIPLLLESSTASESDAATVAVPTPERYRRKRYEKHQYEEVTEEDNIRGLRSKRAWSSEGDRSSDDGNVRRHNKHFKTMNASAVGAPPLRPQPSDSPSLVSLDYIARTLEAFEKRVRKEAETDQRQLLEALEGRVRVLEDENEQRRKREEALQVQVDQQREEINALQAAHDELEFCHGKSERRQADMEEAIDALEAHVDGVAQDCETHRGQAEQLEGLVEDLAKDVMEPLVEQHLEQNLEGQAEAAVRRVEDDIRRRLRRAFGSATPEA